MKRPQTILFVALTCVQFALGLFIVVIVLFDRSLDFTKFIFMVSLGALLLMSSTVVALIGWMARSVAVAQQIESAERVYGQSLTEMKGKGFSGNEIGELFKQYCQIMMKK